LDAGKPKEKSNSTAGMNSSKATSGHNTSNMSPQSDAKRGDDKNLSKSSKSATIPSSSAASAEKKDKPKKKSKLSFLSRKKNKDQSN
jgi:hypothetical protein